MSHWDVRDALILLGGEGTSVDVLRVIARMDPRYRANRRRVTTDLCKLHADGLAHKVGDRPPYTWVLIDPPKELSREICAATS